MGQECQSDISVQCVNFGQEEIFRTLVEKLGRTEWEKSKNLFSLSRIEPGVCILLFIPKPLYGNNCTKAAAFQYYKGDMMMYSDRGGGKPIL